MRLIVTCALYFGGDLRIESNVRFLLWFSEVTFEAVGHARSRCGVGSVATSLCCLHALIRGVAPRITSDVRAGAPVLDPINAALAFQNTCNPRKRMRAVAQERHGILGSRDVQLLTSTSHVVRWALPSLRLKS